MAPELPEGTREKEQSQIFDSNIDFLESKDIQKITKWKDEIEAKAEEKGGLSPEDYFTLLVMAGRHSNNFSPAELSYPFYSDLNPEIANMMLRVLGSIPPVIGFDPLIQELPKTTNSKEKNGDIYNRIFKRDDIRTKIEELVFKKKVR